jgi:hypothetical protein
MATVRSVGCNVYVDPEGVAFKVKVALVDKGIDGEALARSVAERPKRSRSCAARLAVRRQQGAQGRPPLRQGAQPSRRIGRP